MNDLHTWADYYATRDWHILPIVSGKHAGSVLGKGWHHKTSCDMDVISSWFKQASFDSIGVHLGAISGIIDVEADSSESNRLADELFEGVETISFRSPRSVHRLFAWDDRLLRFKTITIKVDGIECRIGGTNRDGSVKGCMSVFPPSDGREWIISPNNRQPARIPDHFMALMLQAGNRQPVYTEAITLGGVDVSDRMRSYVDAADVPTVGDRNNNLFRLAGHLYSFGASCEQCLRLVADHNRKCPEPLGAAEVMNLVRSANVNGTPREVKKEREVIQPIGTDGVDLSGIISSGKKPKENLVFPKIELEGFLKEVVEHNLATARFPQPQFALAGALSLLGAMCGRLVECAGTRTNIYTICIGPTGCGKDHARRINKKLQNSAEAKFIGPPKFASGAGLVSALYDMPSMLTQTDEMGLYLRDVNSHFSSSHQREISTLMMEFFTSAWEQPWEDKGRADATTNKQIYEPNLCIFGTTTPRSFWDSLTSGNVESGLLGRLLMFEGEYVDRQNFEPNRPVSPKLIDIMTGWLRYRGEDLPGCPNGATVVDIPLTSEAQARYDAREDEARRRAKSEDELRQAIWVRSGEHVHKVAGLLACSRTCDRHNLEVDLKLMNDSIKIVNFSMRRMVAGIDQIADSEQEQSERRVNSFLAKNGPSNVKRINQGTRGTNAKIILDILKNGVKSGDIEKIGNIYGISEG